MKKEYRVYTVLMTIIAVLILWRTGSYTSAAPAGPDPTMHEEEDLSGSISVSGSSAIRVQPDRVVVIIGVETYGLQPQSARTLNARSTRNVLQAIQAQSIEEKDISTAHFTLEPDYEDGYYQRNIVGYWTRNTLAITLKDVDKLEDVLIAALDHGATSIDSVEFSVTNLRELKDQARALAVEAAVEKAEDMAGAAGMKVTGVTGIQENSDYWHYFGAWRSSQQWTNVQNVVQELAADPRSADGEDSISLGQIVVKAQVSLTAIMQPE
jgi:uncharacterized protein